MHDLLSVLIWLPIVAGVYLRQGWRKIQAWLLLLALAHFAPAALADLA